MYVIYGMIDPRTDAVFYIGQSSDFAARKAAHLEGSDQLSGFAVKQMKLNGLVLHAVPAIRIPGRGGAPRAACVTSTRCWYRRHRKYNNRRKFCIGIRPKGESGLIGYELAEVSSRDVATLSVLIGDRAWWGKGVVQETRSAIIKFLFEQVGCARVWGTPNARNFPSVFNYQKLGFTFEGTMRQHSYDPRTKQRVDLLMFSILRDEWLERRKRQEVT